MNKKLNKKRIVLAILIVLIIVLLVIGSIIGFNMSSVDKNAKPKSFVIEEGSSSSAIIEKLDDENIIRNAFLFKVYYKFKGNIAFKAGNYKVDPGLNSFEIYKGFKSNKFEDKNGDLITFKEGQIIKDLAKLIGENTKYKENDFLSLMKDQAYIKSLIKEYWFLDEKILDKDIYYPLEGYLFPDTYRVTNQDLKGITKMMLDRTLKELNNNKTNIEKSKYSVHELLTLASIIEQEGLSKQDRENVSSVFYNRLAKNMNLGSDVTTYYAVGIKMNERDLKMSELTSDNPYNTRGNHMMGKLPIGPICNPSAVSVNASINPSSTKYLYFVSDAGGKLYFSNTNDEHTKTVNKLKKAGNYLWMTD